MSISKKINLLQLILLSLSAVISLRSLPLFAEVGSQLIFFLLTAMLFFFIPLAIIIAELSSTWPSESGCYLWIKKAYGKQIAFIAMWAYWLESIIWFPTLLSFIASALAYTLFPIIPDLKTNNLFYISSIVIIFWIVTFMNFYGVKISTAFSTFGVIIGTIIPIAIIISLGLTYFINTNSTITLNFEKLMPAFNIKNLVFFSGILLSISGIELISFHTNLIENPKKTMPKAIIISSCIIFLIYLFSGLSITIIATKSDTCLASGTIEAIEFFFKKNHLSSIIPFANLLLLLGALAGLNTWIMGPVRGIFTTSQDKYLPEFLRKINKKNIPTNLLIIQAIIGSSISVFFYTFTNNINGLIWIFTTISFQFSSLFYITIFLSAIKLRQKYPDINRPYKAPFIKIITFSGITMCIFTFFMSFLQPETISIMNSKLYIILIISSFIILMLPAYIFIQIKKNN